MKFRDALKFSLELILPERVFLAVERFAFDHSKKAKPTRERSIPTDRVGSSSKNAQRIIEELDNSQFGGPSFGPQTIALMSRALEEALASLPQPIADGCAREIAGSILKIAAAGERDHARLRTQAMSSLNLDGEISLARPEQLPRNSEL